MIILPAILESFRSLVSKSYKVTFETNELTPEQMVGLNSGLGTFGYLAFKEDPFKQSEKDMIESLESDFEDPKKSQGQRLRGVLYRLWEQSPEGFDTFVKFYDHKTEKIIGHYKDMLE